MSNNITMFNILMNKLDLCKKECSILNGKLNMFDLNCINKVYCKSNDILDEERQALINKIKDEKEYEKFYKEAIMNLTKNYEFKNKVT